MNVRIHWEPGTDHYGLYVSNDLGGYSAAESLDPDGNVIFRYVEQGERIKPLMRIPGPMIDALREAFLNESPKTAGGLDQLRDAMKIRDELLSMVTAAWRSRVVDQ